MRGLASLVFALCVSWLCVGREARAEEDCYDIAVFGHIVEAGGFVALDQLVEPDPNEIYLGGRWDLRVRVSRVLVGQSIPRTIDVRALMTSLRTSDAVLLFFLKRDEGEPYYRAVFWLDVVRDANGQLIVPNDDSLPVRCTQIAG